MTQVNTTRIPASSRTRAKKEYLRLRSLGYESTMVPIGPVREHINTLHGWGLPLNTIARLAGTGHERIHDIYNGEGEQVRLWTAAKIMDVSYLPRPEGVMVLAIGATRRVQALQRVGYPQKFLERELGWASGAVSHMVTRKFLRWTTWVEVRDLYERLAASRGPSKSAAMRATSKGWPSPWDWETANIDDPLSYPAEDSGPSRGMLKRQAAALDGPHMSARALAEHLGVSTRTIERWRTERRNSGKEVGGE